MLLLFSGKLYLPLERSVPDSFALSVPFALFFVGFIDFVCLVIMMCGRWFPLFWFPLFCFPHFVSFTAAFHFFHWTVFLFSLTRRQYDGKADGWLMVCLLCAFLRNGRESGFRYSLVRAAASRMRMKIWVSAHVNIHVNHWDIAIWCA